MEEENKKPQDELIPPSAAPQQPPEQQPQQPEQKQQPQPPTKKPKPKRLLVAAIAIVLALLLAFVIFVVVFAAQAGTGQNPLLRLFGVTETDFIPLLITIANVFFGLAVFITFLIAIVGVFRVAMAKKGDKLARKKGLKTALVGGILFIIFALVWGVVFVYLDAQRAKYAIDRPTELIQTIPAEVTGLTAPIVIQFDASNIPYNPALHEILSYEWDFGDGTSATGPTISHKYIQKGPDAGRYTVKLSITFKELRTGEIDSQEFTKNVSIENERVFASFTADPTEGEAPLTVSFDASDSIDPDGQIVAYEWDLDGDGAFDDGDEVTVEFTYEREGTYDARLRVVDNNNEFDIAEQEIEVAAVTLPTPIIEITNPDDELVIGKAYNFDASKSYSRTGRIVRFEWDFGDGTTSTSRVISHAFSNPGSYSVTLTVIDDDDKIGEGTKVFEIRGPKFSPVAVLESVPEADPDTSTVVGEAPLEVYLSALKSTDPDDNIVEYKWDFENDGVIDHSGETVTNVYRNEGTYNVVLYVTDADDNTSQASIIVRVSPQSVRASFTADPISGQVPLEVSFDASGSSYPTGQIVSYEWEFGDGSEKILGTAQITYQFVSTGTFQVSVRAIASDGTSDIATVNVNVLPVGLTACFDADPQGGDAPAAIEFDPSCSAGTIASYEWDFGDGAKSFERKPTHTYNTPGNYPVGLKTTDASGVIDDFTLTLTIN